MAAETVLRDLLVRLGVVGGDEAAGDLEKVERAASQLKGTLDGLVRGAAGVIASLSAIAASGVALAVTAASNAEALQQQSAALNVNVEALQELGFAFSEVEGGADLMESTLFTIKGRAEDALAGNEALAESFRAVGVSVGSLRSASASSLFESIAEGVATADDQGKALAATMRLLGEDVARRVAPLLVQGVDGIRSLRTEARDLGLVTKAETIVATAELAVQWRQLTQVGRALRDEIGAAIAPTVGRLVERLLDWVKANREVISTRLESFVKGITQLFVDWAPIIALVASEVIALATALGILIAVPAIAAFVAANGVFVAVAGVIALLTGAVIALGLAWEDFLVYVRGGDSLIGRLLEQLERWSPALASVARLVLAVVDALRAFVGLGARVVFASLTRAVDRLGTRLQPVVALVRTLWGLISRSVDVGWINNIAGALRGAAMIADRVDVPLRGNSTTTNNTTTTNNRADIVQNVQVTGSDAAETTAGLLRSSREAVAGGVR